MDPIEKAIRNALEKGNADDRTFREKVYRSAFAALERATQAQPNLTVEVAINRRKNLQAKITSIESEYIPALPAEPQELSAVSAPKVGNESEPVSQAPEVSLDGPAGAPPAVEVEPVLDSAPEPTVGEPPKIELGVEPPARQQKASPTSPIVDEVLPDRNETRAKPKRRPFAALFIGVTLFAAAAMGAWWALQVGLFKLPSEIDTSVPNPPIVVEGEDFDPDSETPGLSEPGKATDLRNWITVFTPSDPAAVSAPSGATAEVNQDESGSFLRIRSGASGAAVVFDLGQGILEQIAGKKAVFDIVARAEGGKQTEISVSCDFAELGDCGRRRYAVGYERGEYLFDIELPEADPGAGGSIAINSDFANDGKAVDVYQIRVAIIE